MYTHNLQRYAFNTVSEFENNYENNYVNYEFENKIFLR